MVLGWNIQDLLYGKKRAPKTRLPKGFRAKHKAKRKAQRIARRAK
jgi:hypothetical protein